LWRHGRAGYGPLGHPPGEKGCGPDFWQCRVRSSAPDGSGSSSSLLLGTPAAATPRLQGTPRPQGTPRNATVRPPILNAAAAVRQQSLMVSRFAYPGTVGQLRGVIAPLGESASTPHLQPGPGDTLITADGTTHVAPGLRQPAPAYGLNPYSYVAHTSSEARSAVAAAAVSGISSSWHAGAAGKATAPGGRIPPGGGTASHGDVRPQRRPGIPPTRPLRGSFFVGILAATAATDGQQAAADSSSRPPISPAG
jgi:hypothetical protein